MAASRINEASIETSRLVNALRQTKDVFYVKEHLRLSRVAQENGDLDAAQAALNGCDEQAASEALSKHLWIHRYEDYCPLTPLSVEGNELADMRGLFLYSRGFVWNCNTPLSDRNWKTLISAEMGTHEPDDEDIRLNRHVSVEVRREVWRRDQGRCLICGSQERLEFD